MKAVVLVDARNVVRSRWPNLDENWFVERARAWAAREGARALIVFDGRAVAATPDERGEVVGSGGRSADDWIAEHAERLARGVRPSGSSRRTEDSAPVSLPTSSA